MKRGRARRRWSVVLLVLPALLAFAGYVLVLGLPLRREATANAQVLAETQAAAPSRDTMLQETKARADALRAEVTAVTAARREAERPTEARVVAGHARAEWRRALSEVLARHCLSLQHEERIDADLPPAIARSLVPDAGTTTRLRAPTWRLEVSGAYLDVVRAVDELRGAAMPFHLLQLTMLRAEGGLVSWTLVLC